MANTKPVRDEGYNDNCFYRERNIVLSKNNIAGPMITSKNYL